jgi:hypothetical protein
MITDNTSLILFRLFVFASLPVVAGVFALVVMRRPVDRDTLQPLFYAQCFATTPVVLLCSVAATLTRLPQPGANIPAAIIFIGAAVFYIGVEASWFAHETRQRPLIAVSWALAAFAMSALVVGGIVLLFAGI